MKIGHWIIISILLHITVLLAYNIKTGTKSTELANVKVIRMEDFQIQQPEEVVVDEGEMKAVDKKIVQTNKQVIKKVAPASDGTADYLPFHLVEELPSAMTVIDPPYPEDARRLGLEGRVKMNIFIDENGYVSKVTIISSPHKSLSAATIKALKETRFRPAKINGEPRAVTMRFAIKFKLE